MECTAVRCGASGESGKKVAAAPLSKTAAAAKTWFAKHPLDYMLHNRFPWKRSGRRSSMWPPYSLRWNLSAAACCPCDRSLNDDHRGRSESHFACYSHCYVTWRPLATGNCCLTMPSSRDAVLVTRYLEAFISKCLNAIKIILTQ